MMSVDYSRSGTPAVLWERDPRMPALPRLDLDGIDSVIVVAAHADDELLGAGTLIAECGRLGVPVSVLVIAAGPGCHLPVGPDPADSTHPGAAAAVHSLASGANLEAFAFDADALAEHRSGIATALDGAITRSAHGRTLVVAPWRGDGQRDHVIVGEIAAAVADHLGHELLEYPVWLWHWAAPHDDEVPWESFVALDADVDSVTAKLAAIEALSTVPGIDGDAGEEAQGHPRFLRHFGLAREVFVRQHPGHDRLDAAHFDALYTLAEDPWGFGTRWYEKRRRATILAALPDERYPTALEIGSSIGMLTEELAGRCSRLLAVDVSPVAVERARARLAGSPHVSVECVDVATEFPAGPFDLVVLSEVGYFFTRPVLDRVLRDILDGLADAGTLVVCHWRHSVEEYPATGDEVHTVVGELRGLTRLVHHAEEDFLLEVYSRDGRSVARRTGLL